MRTLKTVIMGLDSIATDIGIWAEAPFTEKSAYRIGQVQFENGGKLDDMEFVGTLAELSPYFSPAQVCVRWGYSEDSVSTTDGNDELCPLGAPADLLNPAADEIARAEAASLWKAHIAHILSESKNLRVCSTPEAFQEWLAESRAAVECGVDADTLQIAAEDGDLLTDKLGWIELYVEENDGNDEAAFLDVEAETLLEWAEDRRQNVNAIEAEMRQDLARERAAPAATRRAFLASLEESFRQDLARASA